MKTEILYRAEPVECRLVLQPGRTVVDAIRIEEFKVLRETPGGYWIKKPFEAKEVFVLKGNGKRFAHEKIEWALFSLKRRKMAQIRILKEQLSIAQSTDMFLTGVDLLKAAEQCKETGFFRG